MKTKTDLSPYIVNVQGKDFVTFPGLLAEAHARGLSSMKTEWVNSNIENPIMKATVVLKEDGVEKEFTGYGDANVNNVAKKVAGALLRMAETRSLARALRFACNIDMAALEELDAEENVINKSSKPSVNAPKTFNTKPAAVSEDVSVSKSSTSTSMDGMKATSSEVNDSSQVATKFVKPNGVLPTAKFGRPKVEPKFP